MHSQPFSTSHEHIHFLGQIICNEKVVHDTHAVGLRITRKHNCHLPAMMLAVIVVSNLRYALHAQ